MTIPAKDAALLADAVAFLRGMAARNDVLEVVAFVATPDGTTPRMRAVMVGEGGRDMDRMRLVASLRHMSIRTSSPRSAVAIPEWIVDSDVPAAVRSATRLLDRGKSIAGHPGARETISVILESDAGRTIARLPIVRSGGEIQMGDDPSPFFSARRPDDRHVPGTITDFHVPTRDRIDPEVMAWARRMDGLAGDMVPASG